MWGRIRHGLNQHGDESKCPTNKVTIVYDAPQHPTFFCHNDFSAILSNNCLNEVNRTFNYWCNINNLPLTDRMHNNDTKKKIHEIIEQFSFLRYSVVNEKFYLYKGKLLGNQSFAKSVDNFNDYMLSWKGEPTNAICEAPFEIKSFLLIPPQQIDKFQNYIKEKGFLNGVLLSPQLQKEMLDYISDVLMIRQKSNETKKYTNLSKALSTLGYALIYRSHNKKSKVYGYAELVKLPLDGGVFFDTI